MVYSTPMLDAVSEAVFKDALGDDSIREKVPTQNGSLVEGSLVVGKDNRLQMSSFVREFRRQGVPSSEAQCEPRTEIRPVPTKTDGPN
jgi:hypothetical protein